MFYDPILKLTSLKLSNDPDTAKERSLREISSSSKALRVYYATLPTDFDELVRMTDGHLVGREVLGVVFQRTTRFLLARVAQHLRL